jgi:hypothetical protein
VLAVAELHRRLVRHLDLPDAGDEATWTAAAEFMADLVADWERGQVEAFSDAATDWLGFADSVAPMPFEEAINYFRSLVPTLGTDPRRDGPRLERRAFTIAVNTDQVLLEKIQNEIRTTLETGRSLPATTRSVQTLLTNVGVTPANPQYSELIARTNMLDAFNTGSMRELQDPDVKETFPAWQYLAVVDGRQRPWHGDKNGNVYSSDVTFAEVRDSHKGEFDGFNCRCSFLPLSKYDLASSGVTVRTAP